MPMILFKRRIVPQQTLVFSPILLSELDMHRFSLLLAGLLLSSLPAHADDTTTATMLEGLGGKVVRSGSVVTEIDFRDSSGLGVAQWEAIGGLAGLKKITVYGKAGGLNDATVPQLLRLKNLQSFSADGAQLSDEGLRIMSGCASLRSVSFFHLSFRMEGFTGEGFASWAAMPNLERLTVAGMSMGDAGFAAIAKITTLKELRTWHTYQTEGGNAAIATLPGLESLMVGQRLPGQERPLSLSDESLATFAEMKSLKFLEIGESRFSVAALRRLGSLPLLEKLKITRTEISAEDVEALRMYLPMVKIEFLPLTDDQRKQLKMYLK
jgi:hypothetical protein